MTAEENKALVRRYFEEVLDTGEYDRVEELITPEYINYIVGPGRERVILGRGPGSYRPAHLGFRAAFPDLPIKTEEGVLVSILTIWVDANTGICGISTPS